MHTFAGFFCAHRRIHTYDIRLPLQFRTVRLRCDCFEQTHRNNEQVFGVCLCSFRGVQSSGARSSGAGGPSLWRRAWTAGSVGRNRKNSSWAPVRKAGPCRGGAGHRRDRVTAGEAAADGARRAAVWRRWTRATTGGVARDALLGPFQARRWAALGGGSRRAPRRRLFLAGRQPAVQPMLCDAEHSSARHGGCPTAPCPCRPILRLVESRRVAEPPLATRRIS